MHQANCDQACVKRPVPLRQSLLQLQIIPTSSLLKNTIGVMLQQFSSSLPPAHGWFATSVKQNTFKPPSFPPRSPPSLPHKHCGGLSFVPFVRKNVSVEIACVHTAWPVCNNTHCRCVHIYIRTCALPRKQVQVLDHSVPCSTQIVPTPSQLGHRLQR